MQNVATGHVTTWHHEDGSWWVESTARPGWVAVADDLGAVNALVAEAGLFDD